VIILEEVVDTVQETAKQPVKVTKVRKLVPEHPDPALKVDRCLYTEESLKEDLPVPVQKISLLLT
jgi:hypothetical protein